MAQLVFPLSVQIVAAARHIVLKLDSSAGDFFPAPRTAVLSKLELVLLLLLVLPALWGTCKWSGGNTLCSGIIIFRHFSFSFFCSTVGNVLLLPRRPAASSSGWCKREGRGAGNLGQETHRARRRTRTDISTWRNIRMRIVPLLVLRASWAKIWSDCKCERKTWKSLCLTCSTVS